MIGVCVCVCDSRCGPTSRPTTKTHGPLVTHGSTPISPRMLLLLLTTGHGIMALALVLAVAITIAAIAIGGLWSFGYF